MWGSDNCFTGYCSTTLQTATVNLVTEFGMVDIEHEMQNCTIKTENRMVDKDYQTYGSNCWRIRHQTANCSKVYLSDISGAK